MMKDVKDMGVMSVNCTIKNIKKPYTAYGYIHMSNYYDSDCRFGL